MNFQELTDLLSEKRFPDIRRELINLQIADIGELISELNIKEALQVYRLLPKDLASDVFAYLDIETQTQITELVSEKELKELLSELDFDDKIDLIEEVPANVVKRIFQNTTVTERALINQFLNYPEQSAGSLMTIGFVDLKKEMTVSQAMERIRKTGLGKETIYTCYVLDTKRKLEGIVTLRELVLCDVDKLVEDIMETEVIYINTHDDQEHIASMFKKYDFLSMPVVDNENRLVGIITIDDVVDVIEEETTEDFQKMAATTPTDEEYMVMKPFSLAKKRIFWLIILMFSALITEFITNKNAYITREFVVLVSMMPMLMSTGGNAGAQASTLVIRGLTLGDIHFKDIFFVVFKEVRVGIIVGVLLGVLNFIRILLTNGDPKIAAIVGLTLIGTTTMAATMGGTLPIVAKKIKLDPAIMASPLITTITDATTLIIFFAISALVLL